MSKDKNAGTMILLYYVLSTLFVQLTRGFAQCAVVVPPAIQAMRASGP
jgi:hypothetical protein